MLSRAARNAYSWWWASHIRTKQSKWLDQNLQDMEEKVDYILKIVTEDGDSFRVRAEQYYSKRPELVNFIEDTFRGYRALAERYDHLSRDLQSANRTIAIVFPERVEMSFDEEDYGDFALDVDEKENNLTASSNVPLPLPFPPKQNIPKMKNVVQAMLKKKPSMPKKMMSKRGLITIGVDGNESTVSKSSGLSKDEALEEIEKLQKEILGFQTEKEFVKSLYENGLSQYWEIENNINEMHTKISNLQHEFVVGVMIEDKDAQTLMSSSALKMCDETLVKLKRKHNRFKKEAVVEHKRVAEIRQKFEALIACNNNNSDLKNLDQTIEHINGQKEKIEEKQLESFQENGELTQQDQPPHCKNIENFDESERTRKDDNIDDNKARMKEEILGKNEEITISEVAEKIEQLVDKVITVETEVISQTARIMRLRLENDELHEHLESLEQEKNILVDDSNSMSIKLKRLEEELKRVEILDQKVKAQNAHLENSFEEGGVSLDGLFKGLLVAKPDENIPENEEIFQKEIENTSKFSIIEERDEVKGIADKGNADKGNEDKGNEDKGNENKGNGDKGNEDKGNEDKGNEDKGNEDKREDIDDLEVFVNKPNEKDECNDVESKDNDIEERHHQELTETVIDKQLNEFEFVGDQEVDPNWKLVFSHGIDDREKMLLEEYSSTLRNYKEVKQKLNETEKTSRARSFKSAVQMKILRNSNESKDEEIRSLYEKLKLFETNMEKTTGFKENKATLLDDQELQGITRPEETKEFEQKTTSDLFDEVIERTQRENDELDETTHYEIKKASDAIGEGTHRIEELLETAHIELQKARELIGKGTQPTKKPEIKKDPDLFDGRTQRSKELDETTRFELNNEGTQRKKEVDEMTNDELKKARDSVDEGTQIRKEHVDGVDGLLEVEEEIRMEIDDLRKENLELWLRFSTSYHQINRFQDSFNDLMQEIKEVNEKKHDHHGNTKHHQHHRSPSFGSDIRPLYRHLQDMQTEVILWLEKSGILDDDLQHRLASLSHIQDELSDLTNRVSKDEKTSTTLNDYQAAKFQGEVANMKQENVKVLDELRVACERVKTLQIDIEKTLSKIDEELGEKKKNSTKVPFRSFLFGAKLRRKHRRSVFTSKSPTLQRKHSNLEALPQPREDRSHIP